MHENTNHLPTPMWRSSFKWKSVTGWIKDREETPLPHGVFSVDPKVESLMMLRAKSGPSCFSIRPLEFSPGHTHFPQATPITGPASHPKCFCLLVCVLELWQCALLARIVCVEISLLYTKVTFILIVPATFASGLVCLLLSEDLLETFGRLQPSLQTFSGVKISRGGSLVRSTMNVGSHLRQPPNCGIPFTQNSVCHFHYHHYFS